MAKKQVKEKEVPVVPKEETPEVSDKDMLAQAKAGDTVPTPEPENNVAPAPAASEAPAAEVPPPAPEKTQAQIEAEVNAFLGTLQTKEPPKATKSVIPDNVKSADGKTPEELVAEGRTTEAMELISTKVARREREAAMAEIQGNQAQAAYNSKRLEANRKVYMAHPELIDIDKGIKKVQDVPFATVISQVYNEYPNLLQTPEGPVMAMEIAEKRLGIAKSVDTSKQAVPSAVKAEQARQDASRAAAAVASSSSSGRPPAPSDGDVQLSDDEIVVAGKMGLTNVEYGKMRERKSVFGPDYYAKHRGGPRPRRG